MAQPYDLDRLQSNGEMFPVVEQAAAAVNTGTAAFTTSPNGGLAYWPGVSSRIGSSFGLLDRGNNSAAPLKTQKLKMKFHGDLKLASRGCGIGAAEKGRALYADEVLEIDTIQGIERINGNFQPRPGDLIGGLPDTPLR